MAVVTLLEAAFGAGVILDWSDDDGRDAAFRLALLTLAGMEGVDVGAPAFAAVTSYDESFPPAPFEAVLVQLESVVIPAARYLDATICEVGRSRYQFHVLSEDGSALEVAPGWEATDDWYLVFWDTLWRASRELTRSIPSFRLLVRGGERTCTRGHVMSPFHPRCEECGALPQPA